MKKNIYLQISDFPRTFHKNLKQMFPSDLLWEETLYFELCLDLNSGFLNLDSGLVWLGGCWPSFSYFDTIDVLGTVFSFLVSSSSSVTSSNPRYIPDTESTTNGDAGGVGWRSLSWSSKSSLFRYSKSSSSKLGPGPRYTPESSS